MKFVNGTIKLTSEALGEHTRMGFLCDFYANVVQFLTVSLMFREHTDNKFYDH